MEPVGINLLAVAGGGGIANYAHSLIGAMAVSRPDVQFRVFLHLSSPLHWGLQNIQQVRLDYDTRSPIKRRLAERSLLAQQLKRDRSVGLLHSMNNVAPDIPGVRHVVTIHDLLWLVDGRRFGLLKRAFLSRAVRRSVRQATAVIAVSHATRDDLLSRLKADPSRVFVTPEAVPESFVTAVRDWRAAGSPPAPQAPAQGRYFLYVGRLERGKNVLGVLQAYQQARAQGLADCELVVAGRAEWASDYDTELAPYADAPGVRFVGFVPQADLPALYAGAVAFVWPSFYEGFGLPLLEAMHSGTPVITSNVSSLPEVAGDAAIKIDPHSTRELADAMLRLAGDESLRADLIARGRRRCGEFSWSAAARQTLAVYEHVLSQSASGGTITVKQGAE